MLPSLGVPALHSDSASSGGDHDPPGITKAPGEDRWGHSGERRSPHTLPVGGAGNQSSGEAPA